MQIVQQRLGNAQRAKCIDTEMLDHLLVIELSQFVGLENAGVIDEDVDPFIADRIFQARHRTVVTDINVRNNAYMQFPQRVTRSTTDRDDSIATLDELLTQLQTYTTVASGHKNESQGRLLNFTTSHRAAIMIDSQHRVEDRRASLALVGQIRSETKRPIDWTKRSVTKETPATLVNLRPRRLRLKFETWAMASTTWLTILMY